MLLDPERDPYEMTNLVRDSKCTDVVAKLSALVKSYPDGLAAPEREVRQSENRIGINR